MGLYKPTHVRCAGDFVFAMDQMAKETTEELTGKPYEVGDLSKVIDTSIKAKVAEFCGVQEFTGKEGYEFGDISRKIEERRRDWVKNLLGEKAAEEYEFGDVSQSV
jgi:hypothetical protein